MASLNLKFRAFDLPKMDGPRGTADPYLRIFVGSKRVFDGRKQAIKNNNLNPDFPAIRIPRARIPQDLNDDLKIKIELMDADWNPLGNDDEIGYVIATVGQLKAAAKGGKPFKVTIYDSAKKTLMGFKKNASEYENARLQVDACEGGADAGAPDLPAPADSGTRVDLKGCQSQIDLLRAQIESSKYDEASKTLVQIKLRTITFPSMLGQPSDTATQERQLCRDALEAAVVLCTRTDDMPAFERNFAQLKPYYTDFRAELCASKNMAAILGLNLMHLLVENKLSSFHSELELIPLHLRANACVQFPVNLERYLMEGSYSKVNTLSKKLPTSLFTFLMHKLTETVREEIATCVEASYAELSVTDAAAIFSLDAAAMRTFAASKNEWTVDGSRIVFKRAKAAGGRRKTDIPSHQLIEQALEYAIELERIV